MQGDNPNVNLTKLLLAADSEYALDMFNMPFVRVRILENGSDEIHPHPWNYALDAAQARHRHRHRHRHSNRNRFRLLVQPQRLHEFVRHLTKWVDAIPPCH